MRSAKHHATVVWPEESLLAGLGERLRVILNHVCILPEVRAFLEFEVQPQGVVEVRHELSGNPSQNWSNPIKAEGSDLLGLRLGIHFQASGLSRQQGLERKYPRHAAGHRHDGHHAASEPFRGSDHIWQSALSGCS